MTQLVKYNAARTALAEAHAIDEVKDIRNKAEAMAAYARQAKDTDMISWVTEIKVRAERRAGQMLAEMNIPKHRPAEVSKAPTLPEMGISRDQSSRWQKLASVSDEKFEQAVSAAKEIAGEVTTAAMLRATTNVHVSNNSGENEWYTPSIYIEAARTVMGTIDFDPASSEVANKTVKAKKFLTKDDDGLTCKWHGNVWMNPPYAQPLIAQFCSALVEKFDSDEIREAITLVNNATETEWFQNLLTSCSAVCLPKSRIRFIDQHGNPGGAPLQGQAILYFGTTPEAFSEKFSAFGKVLFSD